MQRFDSKVDALLAEMTLSEKISQLKNHAKAIKRLDIKAYDWWNEALHGVGRAGLATVFPQAIGMAATFDVEMVQRVGDMVSTEARAKYNEAQRLKVYSRYNGLTFWSPNINIYRDPRWGRGQETYGEDPYLTAQMGVAYIKGLQGNDPEYLKVSACAKHFAVHSGPEKDRHTQNVEPTKRELFDTYLPAFEKAVKEANVESVMTAYNAVYGEPCSSSRFLLQDLLRGKWKFKGHIVSDCGAIGDIIFKHRKTYNPIKGAAMAIKAGCDLECGNIYTLLGLAVRFKLVSIDIINDAVRRLLMTRAKLGMFDDGCPYDEMDDSLIACKAHEAYAIEVARKSLVMLKNDGVLPLKGTEKIAIIGPNAKSTRMLLGNYEGTPSSFVTIHDGIAEVVGKDNVFYALGCHLVSDEKSEQMIEEAKNAAIKSDVIILCLGLDGTLEGEEGDADQFDEKGNAYRGDRHTLELPQSQIRLIHEMLDLHKKIIVLNCSGGAVTFGGTQEKVNALIQSWYPGAKGGVAVADLLFGKYSPSGRLPVTFYEKDDDLPDFSDYSMADRTYRYFKGKPLYPFGYGLSYSHFMYSDMAVFKSDEKTVIRVDLTNTGDYDAEEVVQVYVKICHATTIVPLWSLKKLKRVFVSKGQTLKLDFELDECAYSYIDDNGDVQYAMTEAEVFVGGCSPNNHC